MPLPFLNQNQMGGSVGGPIRKDKLFFYGTYEAVRAHQQTPAEHYHPDGCGAPGHLQLSRHRRRRCTR